MRNNVGDSLADPVESLMHDSDSSDSGRPIRVGYILDSRQLGSTDVVGLLLSEFADDQAIEWHILYAVGPGLTACMRTRGRKRKSGPFVPLRSWMCGLLLACERSLLALFGRLILNGPDGEKPSSTIRLEVDRRASSCNQAEVIGLSAIEYRKVKQLNLDFLIVDIPLVRMRAISLSCLATQGMFLTQYSNLLGADSRFQSFWDVLNREPTTPFAVEHIRAGGGDPVSRVTGTVSTQASWTATIIQIRRESTVWVSQLLAQYVRLGVVETFGKASITRSAHITHAPGIIDLIRYLYRRIVSIFKSRLRTTRHYSTWSIAVAIGEPSIENLKNAVTVANRQDHFFADPFIYTWKDRTICFAEEFCLLDDRAHIAAIDIVSTREVSEENWEPSIRYLGTVIDEPFNLGFPFVFEYENRIFLIPDSRQANSVRLYECVEFPLQWQYRHDLLSRLRQRTLSYFTMTTTGGYSPQLPQGAVLNSALRFTFTLLTLH